MALIDLDKVEEGGAGTLSSRALREARAEIAALTGSARSTYDLAKDRERDEAALREMLDRRMTLNDF